MSLNKSEKELANTFLAEMEQGTVSMKESLKELRVKYREEYPHADFEKVLDHIIDEIENVFETNSVQWTRALSILSQAKTIYPHKFNFSENFEKVKNR